MVFLQPSDKDSSVSLRRGRRQVLRAEGGGDAEQKHPGARVEGAAGGEAHRERGHGHEACADEVLPDGSRRGGRRTLIRDKETDLILNRGLPRLDYPRISLFYPRSRASNCLKETFYHYL